MRLVRFVILGFLLIATFACNKQEQTIKYEGTFVVGQTKGTNVFYTILNDTVYYYDFLNNTNKYNLDINNKDGINDLTFVSSYTASHYSPCRTTPGMGYSGYCYAELKLSSNTQCLLTSDSLYPEPLNPNDTISFSKNWGIPKCYYLSYEEWCTTDSNTTNYFTNGVWLNTKNKYMVVRILNKDTIYAWIRLSVCINTIKLHDYAYIIK